MKVCPNCFSDKELKAFISSSSESGKCSVCSTENTPLINIEELLDFFQELIDNFSPVENGESVQAKIHSNWNFFSSLENATKILNSVLPELDTDIVHAGSTVDFISDIIDNYEYWEKLKEELKWSRRFLSNVAYLEDLGWDGFFNTQYELTNEVALFRARLHNQSGLDAYSEIEMGCPDPKKVKEVKGGRANPLGIPYLYLSDSEVTTLYEVRASFLDEVSVGTFYLKQEYPAIRIVDFTEEPSLYNSGQVNEIIKAHLLKNRISKDLSKPMRRYDSEIEYIPTQFICEYIRVFTGANGIRFKSSLEPTGNNIVIFDQSLMQCTNVKLAKVNELSIRAVDISKAE